MELSTSLSTATAELGAMDEGLEPEIGATPVASETSEAANALSLNAYTVNAATMRKELDGLMSYNDGLMMALRYTRLERALAQLSAGGKLERSPGVGIYLASGASFYDTEPRPRPDDSYVFALPSAFLLAIRLGSLPAVSIILDVRFLHGDPFVPPDKRAELRHVRSIDAEAHHPDGIWHVIVRYGFAEQPGEGDLATLLARIGQEQAGLGGLTHIHCRPGRCCCSSSACVPVSIFVAREALCGGSMLDALPLGVYNALLHNTAGVCPYCFRFDHRLQIYRRPSIFPQPAAGEGHRAMRHSGHRAASRPAPKGGLARRAASHLTLESHEACAFQASRVDGCCNLVSAIAYGRACARITSPSSTLHHRCLSLSAQLLLKNFSSRPKRLTKIQVSVTRPYDEN